MKAWMAGIKNILLIMFLSIYGLHAQQAFDADIVRTSINESLKPTLDHIQQLIQQSQEIAVADILTSAQKELIPSAYFDIFTRLKLVGSQLLHGPKEYPGSFILKGSTTLYGERVAVSLLYAPLENKKNGMSLSVWLPKGKTLSEIVPDLKGIADISVADLRFVLSNFDYTDPGMGYSIKAALNIIGSVPLESLKMPGIAQAKKLLKTSQSSLVGHVVLKQADSLFTITIPPLALRTPNVSLSDLISLTKIAMPSKVLSSLEKVVFKNTDIGFNTIPGQESFYIKGAVSVFGQNVASAFKVFKTIQGTPATSVSFSMPDGWDIAQYFSELKSAISVPVNNATFLLVTDAYFDDLLDLDLDPGMHFTGAVDVAKLGKNKILHAVRNILGREAVLHGLLASNLIASQFEITFGKGNGVDLSLSDLINVDRIHVPSSLKSALNKTFLTVPEVTMRLSGIEQSLKLHGVVSLFGMKMDSDFHTRMMGDTSWKSNMTIATPGNIKISDIVPELKPIDILNLSAIKFSFIEIPYSDDIEALEFKEGFNVSGLLSFSGILSGLGALTNLKGLPINGVLDSALLNTTLKVKIPKTSVSFGNIKTTGLILRASLKPAFGLETTFLIPVPKEKEPLQFLGSLDLAGDSGTIIAALDGTWKNPFGIKGLTLHGVGLEGRINLVTAFPQGLGIRAALDIGKHQIEFAAKGAVGIGSNEIMLAGSLKNGLYFGDLVALTGSLIGTVTKVNFLKAVSKKIPKIGIQEINMSIAPLPVTIAGKSYPEGMSADMVLKLFGATGFISVRMGANGISGEGSLKKVSLGPLKITNMDGTEGPSVVIKMIYAGGMSEDALSKGAEFVLDGKIALKILGEISSGMKMRLNESGAQFRITQKLFSIYESEIEGSGSIDSIEDWHLKGGFKQHGLDQMSAQLRKASIAFIQLAKEDLKKAQHSVHAQFDSQIEKQREIVRKEREKVSSAIKGAKQTTENAIRKEIAATKLEIADLKASINKKKRKCKKAKWYRKVDKCAKSGIEITNLGIQLAAQETYLHALLKSGKVIVPETIGVAKSAVNLLPIDSDPRVAGLIAAKEIQLAGIKVGKLSAKTIGELGKVLATLGKNIVNIREVFFEGSLDDLSSGKLPKFTLDGVILGKKVKLKEVRLNLEDPVKFTTTIIETVVDLF